MELGKQVLLCKPAPLLCKGPSKYFWDGWMGLFKPLPPHPPSHILEAHLLFSFLPGNSYGKAIEGPETSNGVGCGRNKALTRTVVAEVVFSIERELRGFLVDLRLGWIWTQEGGGRDDTKVPCLGLLMGLGTAWKGSQPVPLAVTMPGDLIWRLADAWI